MNIILLLVTTLGNSINYTTIVFISMHGLLSTLMFFLIDIIQKKTGTRNILELSGITTHVPGLRTYI